MKQYSVYQIKDDAANGRYVKFSSYELVQEMGIALSLDMYEKVYEGQTEVGENEDANVTLEYLYMKFQGVKPEGYKGHSLSVSDLIKMDGVYYYVDDYGFTEVKF